MLNFKNPKIIFVLSSGGARGLAHLGILEVLEKEGIKPDVIIGTSMGALIGGLYAADVSIKEMEETAVKIGKLQKILLFVSLPRKTGLTQGQNIEKLLKKLVGEKRIEDFKIPFYAIATDLERGEEVLINKGPLVKAILASIAVPALITPIKLENRILVDGGVSNPLPINRAREMGGGLVIAFNVEFPLQKINIYPTNVMGILRRSLEIMESKFLESLMSKEKEAIIITPHVTKISVMDFDKANKIILLGQLAAKEKIEEIKKRLNF